MVFKKYSGKLEGTSLRKNQLDARLHGSEELLCHLMSQFFHDFHGWANSVDALLDPLSMIVRTVSVQAEAILLGSEMRPATCSVNAEVVTGTFGIVTVVASEITAGIDFTVLGSAFEV